MAISRPLTPAEIALARTVFGNSVDYSRVRIHDAPHNLLQPKNSALAPNGHIYMYGCFLPDYALAPLYQQAVFIHEMVHVWQHQNRILNPVLSASLEWLKNAGNYSKAYLYTLSPTRTFHSYGLEQQASIVEDFFLMCQTGVIFGGRCQNQEPPQTWPALYKAVLADFFDRPPPKPTQTKIPATQPAP